VSKETEMAEKLPMPLSQAMRILCDIHTRDNAECGFDIIGGASPDRFSYSLAMREPGDYAEAWAVLRAAAGLPTKPEQYEDR
jgi:hypothetical protein